MPSMRSGWTAERQWASIMIAIACSTGWPSPRRTACLTAWTAVVGDPVDRGEDRLAQLPHGVERAVEVLPLPEPVLLRHALALAEVAADREGPLAGARQHDDPHCRADRD